MPQSPSPASNLKVKGLYTAPNDLSALPEGALDIADDISIDQDNLAECRPGFEQAFEALPLTSDRATRFHYFDGKPIAHFRGNKLAYYDDDIDSWQLYTGDFAHPDQVKGRLRFFEALKNLYFPTANGVYKLDQADNDPVPAGVPSALDLQVVLSGSSGFLGTNQELATTGTTTDSSPNLTVLGSTTGIEAGQYVSGSDIPDGTTVSSVTPSATVLTSTGNTTAGSTTLSNIPTNAGLAVDQIISGNGIQPGTRLVSISGAGPYSVVLSLAATATGTGVTVVFSSDPVVTLSANASASASGVSLSFSLGSQVSYRLVFGKRDANNNLTRGAPSQLATVINNTGGTRVVEATATLPAGITEDYFYQLFRSAQTGSAEITPEDDEQQVYEGNPSALDISNGYITITDSTPDSLRGAFLYTSSSQDGIEQQADQPPFCKDACVFKNFTFYANVRFKHRKKLTILGVGSPNGVQAGDELVIGSKTYSAASSEDVFDREFKVFTTGTPSQNIADTASSLMKVINRSDGDVYARLLSGPNDLPGQLMLEVREVDDDFFLISSDRGGAFSPTLPATPGDVFSTQDTYKNGLIVTKYNEPDAAPMVNLLFAGSASKEILRVIPLRSYILVLTEGGLFRLTGDSLSTFKVDPFDPTVILLAPDSAVALSNEVWGLFNQGVCSISDTGVSIRSRPIENIFRTLIGQAIDTVKEISFAMAYETAHKYLIALPGESGDTICQQIYVFNYLTNSWVKWNRACSGGFVHPEEDKIYLGNDNSTPSSERKTGTYQDTCDEAFAVEITDIVEFTGNTATLVSVAGIAVGDVLYQDESYFSRITAVDAETNIVTIYDTFEDWRTGATQVLPGITSVVQWKPVVFGQPAFEKQVPDGLLHFKRTGFGESEMAFYTDRSQSYEGTEIPGSELGVWGRGPWGPGGFGGVNRPKAIPFIVPRNKQYCSQISPRWTIRSAFSNWALEGLSLSFLMASRDGGRT